MDNGFDARSLSATHCVNSANRWIRSKAANGIKSSGYCVQHIKEGKTNGK